ncbi:hypothetical protein HOY80DRAFT_554454 [Tuber brumale]|nr:hypothetical protein HOY80DRAFT_554454 [Tuber brumale]
MGFRLRNSATLLLSLLGLGSILGVDGSWLFGAMEEREQDYRRALQPRQFVQCSAGSKACGVLGCLASRRCCNADGGWGCLTGNACYTASGFVDCYSTTMVMPTVSRKCYDYTASGCTAGQACFRCGSTSAYCATEVLASGTNTWLACDTRSTVLTVTAAAVSTTDSIPTDDPSITPQDNSGTSTGNLPTRTGTDMVPFPTNTTDTTDTTTPSKLGGGAIAGIAVAGLAGIAIFGALIFFLCIKKKNRDTSPAQPPYPQPQPAQMQYHQQPPYSPPPQQQQQYMTQPYSPLPGYQGQMAHNGYGPEGQPMVPPISSPVYPEQPKQPVTLPAELN